MNQTYGEQAIDSIQNRVMTWVRNLVPGMQFSAMGVAADMGFSGNRTLITSALHHMVKSGEVRRTGSNVVEINGHNRRVTVYTYDGDAKVKNATKTLTEKSAKETPVGRFERLREWIRSKPIGYEFYVSEVVKDTGFYAGIVSAAMFSMREDGVVSKVRKDYIPTGKGSAYPANLYKIAAYPRDYAKTRPGRADAPAPTPVLAPALEPAPDVSSYVWKDGRKIVSDLLDLAVRIDGMIRNYEDKMKEGK